MLGVAKLGIDEAISAYKLHIPLQTAAPWSSESAPLFSESRFRRNIDKLTEKSFARQSPLAIVTKCNT